MENAIAPGCRAVVPLGRRSVVGYCIRLSDAPPAFKTRPVAEVVDEEPLLSGEVLRLVKWVADYYCCGLYDAIKASLPQGIEIETEQYAHISTDNVEEAIGRYKRSRAKRAILETLASGEYVSFSDLEELTGVSNIVSHMRTLEQEGLVHVETVMERPKVRPKKIAHVRLLFPWTREEKMREAVTILEKRAPKQVNVLTTLYTAYKQGRESLPLTELLKTTGASSGTVRALAEKELVAVEQVEQIRRYTSHFTEEFVQHVLNSDQQRALESITTRIDEGTFESFLLYGVTASGKTQVYIETLRHALDTGKTALVLVPEIALTPQLVYRFTSAFGDDVIVMHSRMGLGERYDAWRLVREEKVRVVVGVRSAVFAPLKNLGVVVVDEEHEATYKQSDMTPRYHARDVAVVRARFNNCPVVLGSATPSGESWHNSVEKKYHRVCLPKRVENIPLPRIIVVDLREGRKAGTLHGSLSGELIDAVRERLKRKEGVILLQNRRGYAPHLECRDCGHVESCDNCSISLTYHKVQHRLRCHYCGASRPVPEACPRCGGADLETVGTGTQRVEEDLERFLPEARVIRMDLDTTTHKRAFDTYLSAFADRQADILLGTQMVAKGLDLPHVTLVGVINADNQLFLPDFRSGERTFQLLTQVSGRSGRTSAEGEVIIQTAHPDHPVIQKVVRHDYELFIEEELDVRRKLNYPPYTRLVLLECSGSDESKTAAAAARLADMIPKQSKLLSRSEVAPAAIFRVNRRYRFHLLLRVRKSADPGNKLFRAYINTVIQKWHADKEHRGVRLTIDVDPQEFM